MGRASTKENKNIYFTAREECKYTRAQASEKMVWISDSKIEKIESEKAIPTPEEVLVMADVYKKANLCNYYCSHECAIGKKYVPEVKEKSLADITLMTLRLLNDLQKKKDRLIEITSDGAIHDDEIEDFVEIKNNLESLSTLVGSLRYWFDGKINSGDINSEILEEVLKKYNK